MDWLSNSWIFLGGLALCVLILLGLFGRRGPDERAHGARGCCAGMEPDKESKGSEHLP